MKKLNKPESGIVFQNQGIVVTRVAIVIVTLTFMALSHTIKSTTDFIQKNYKLFKSSSNDDRKCSFPIIIIDFLNRNSPDPTP